MLLTRINFVTDLVRNRLPGARVQPEVLRDAESFKPLVAAGRLSPATYAALSETGGFESVALLLSSQEFQRR
jgi:hypothetical protein